MDVVTYPYHEGMLKSFAIITIDQQENLSPKCMNILDPIALSLKVHYHDSCEGAKDDYFQQKSTKAQRNLVLGVYATNAYIDVRKWTKLI